MPLFSLSGKRPDTLGAPDGQLAACPKAPKCVSSQLDAGPKAIPPLTPASGDSGPQALLERAAEALSATPGVVLVTRQPDYLHAECTTPLMGFVDDLECVLGDGVVHVRSCSRLGHSDLGANRKRVEALRAALAI